MELTYKQARLAQAIITAAQLALYQQVGYQGAAEMAEQSYLYDLRWIKRSELQPQVEAAGRKLAQIAPDLKRLGTMWDQAFHEQQEAAHRMRAKGLSPLYD